MRFKEYYLKGIESKLHSNWKKFAVDKNTTMRRVILEALEKYIAQEENKHE